MRTTTRVAHSPHATVQVVECQDHHDRWSDTELATAAAVVLVRQGRFRIRTYGREMTIDPTSGYLQVPGQESTFSHPAGGDVCTSVTLLDDALVESIVSAPTPGVRVDGRLELAHRVLVRSRADPDFAAMEAILGLLQLALRRSPDDVPGPGRRALADRAREAIVADEPASASLITLARALETSPSHLSRTFRHHAGISLTRYRNRVRVSRALQRLDDGDRDLAGLAAILGFSDQAHLTRTMRQHLGHTPRRVRALLSPPDPAAAGD